MLLALGGAVIAMGMDTSSRSWLLAFVSFLVVAVLDWRKNRLLGGRLESLLVGWVVFTVIEENREFWRVALVVAGATLAIVGGRHASGQPLFGFRRWAESGLPRVAEVLRDWLSGVRAVVALLRDLWKRFLSGNNE